MRVLPLVDYPIDWQATCLYTLESSAPVDQNLARDDMKSWFQIRRFARPTATEFVCDVSLHRLSAQSASRTSAVANQELKGHREEL